MRRLPAYVRSHRLGWITGSFGVSVVSCGCWGWQAVGGCVSLWTESADGGEPPALQVGFSPSPNESFMFHGLLHGAVRTIGLGPIQPFLAHPLELSERALDPDRCLAVSHLTVPTLARVVDRYAVLPSGAAMGYGVGPMVVCRSGGPATLGDLAGCRVAVPGEHTIARLLVQIFGPSGMELVPTPTDRIAAAVQSGDVVAGVLTHDGRFTFTGLGLECVADLGDVWGEATGLPLPLGLVCVRRDLPGAVVETLGEAVRASVQWGLDHPGAAWDYIRAHCRDMDEEVCRRQIHLYVSDHSLSIGHTGKRAVEQLLARGREAGMLPAGRSPWSDPH